MTYEVSWEVSETAERRESATGYNDMEERGTYIVKRMLMSKSQLHPVMKAAAAGGNKIAT